MGTICEEKKCIYRNNKSYNHCGTCAGLYDEPLTTEKESVAASPAAMAGSTAIAGALKVKISGILMDAIAGNKEKYRNPNGFIRWGVVEADINETIDAALR